tara:strand:+ start:19544 stop:19801 length:258 start_codon:yes stop_codon:yes gene_type:complete
MKDNRIIIFGRKTCVFCVYSVDFCEAKGIRYDFLDYYNKPEILEDYKDFYNQKTVPIILANCLDTGVTKKVGGYQDLLEYFKDEQ